jgi:hypothetical protein
MSLLLALLGIANATVPDLYGLGADRVAMGGAGGAISDDGTSAVLNPAGLGAIRRPTLTLGGLWGRMDLAESPPVWWDTNRDGLITEDDPPLTLGKPVDDVGGFHLSIGRHLGGRFGFGLAMWFPAQRLFRLKTFEPSLPTYIMYDNRPQRYELAAGFGGEVLPGVRVGAAINVVPRVRFTVGMVADIAITGSEDTEDLSEVIDDVVVDVNEIKLDVVPGFTPVLGLQFDLGRWHRALRGLRLGASWRGTVGVPVKADIDIQANVRAEDLGSLEPIALAGVINADMSLYDHYVPMKVEISAAWTFDPWIDLAIDARWTDWRGMVMSVARIEDASLTTPLVDVGDAIRDGNDHEVTLRSTWSVRAGGAVRLPRVELDKRARYVQVAMQAGAGFEPTPLVSQGVESALLDADRWWLAGGLSLETWDPFRLVNGPLRVATFFQYHRLLPAALPHASDTPRAGWSRAGDIPASGSMLVIGGEVGFEY